MKFERTDKYMTKLFEQALFDEKRVIQDATITIIWGYEQHKLKAWCEETETYLQFPRHLRIEGREFTADVVEVIRTDGVQKYYRAMPKSIRNKGSNEVIA